jgi:hypothetical protein
MTLAELEQQRAAVPADDALPATATQADLAANRSRRALLDRRLMQAREAASTLATLGSADADREWLDRLNIWRPALNTELLALKPSIRDPHTLGVARNLALSIECIDFGPGVLRDSGYELTTLRLGALMREAGYEPVGAAPERGYLGQLPWFGTIAEAEARIAALAAKRAQAQSALDDALLDDAVREQQEAEAEKWRRALDGLRLRGPNLLVQDRDEADLTPLEKEALARARRAARGETVTSS